MNGVVDIAPLAAEDLLEIYAFIANDRPRAADRFLKAAHRWFQMLADMPGIGRERIAPDPTLRGLRSWPIHGFRNFIAFYRPIGGGIEMLRVMHGARDFGARFGK